MHIGAQDIQVVYGDSAVYLRPSLRAAVQLERTQGGFPALLNRLQQFDTSTVQAIIRATATDPQAVDPLLGAFKGAPLRSIRDAVTAPAFVLITALMTPVAATKQQGEAAKAPSGKPVAWSDLYADLYQIATGWLGWPPATAWNATLTEITSAFDGHIAMLKAVHGSGTDDTQTTGTNDAQRQANIDAGLDPDFDRTALQALKDKIR
jgi:hypothetical protein